MEIKPQHDPSTIPTEAHEVIEAFNTVERSFGSGATYSQIVGHLRRRYSLKWVLVWPLIIVLVFTLFGETTASGQEPIDSNHSRLITMSRDTTFVTDPQREDGTIDYPKWLNQHMGDGASPENNAMVLIYQATGRLGQPDQVFEMIGGHALEPIEQVFKSWSRPKSKVFQAAKIKPWKANSDPELNQWLETNSKAMEIVLEASFREHFYSPLICDDTQIIFNIRYPHLDATREIAHAFAIRAMLHLGENDIANA